MIEILVRFYPRKVAIPGEPPSAQAAAMPTLATMTSQTTRSGAERGRDARDDGDG
jgi:hypothetical protein